MVQNVQGMIKLEKNGGKKGLCGLRPLTVVILSFSA